MTGLSLSVRFKEACKTALAMVLAYGIALSMGWEKPMWAGFAIAVVSLETVGQSLQKAIYRMAGTLLAVVAALSLLALFPQDRWLFMVFLSAYLALCTYLMAGPRRQYIWNIAGAVCLIIVVGAGPEGAWAFDIAILRGQETGLGILVYGVVTVLLWPRSSHDALIETVRGLAASQRNVFQSQLASMKENGDLSEPPPSSAALAQTQSRCSQLLGAAEVDSYQVWEALEAWRRGLHQHEMINETLESWRQSFEELRQLDIDRLLPNLDAFVTEIDRRLTQVEGMYEGIEPARAPERLELRVDGDAVRELSHFDRTALIAVHDRLQQLDQLTQSLFETVRAIAGSASLTPVVTAPPPDSWGTMLDLERIGGVLRVVVSVWLAYLAVIFIPDLPGGFTTVILVGSLALALSQMPQVPISAAFIPVAVSTLVAGSIYLLIMPKLSSFVGLGLLIFFYTFIICYLFASPRQMIGRSVGLILFLMITGISENQSYNFLSVANTAMMFVVVFSVIAITAHFPISTKPTIVVPRFASRFFRSCQYLISRTPLEQPPPTAIERLRTAFHLHEVATLPGKLAAWSGFLSHDAVPAEARPHVQELGSQLGVLARRIEQLCAARGSPQAEVLVRQMLQDLGTWRAAIQVCLARLAEDPADTELPAFVTSLGPSMAHLEARIETALNQASEGTITPQQEASFYRLLGAYRGVSDALAEVIRVTALVDWGRMREVRF